jgi:hypothetical protein
MKTQVRSVRLTTALLAAVVALLLAGCNPQNDLEPTTRRSTGDMQARKSGDKVFYGPATPLGKGVARAWVSVDDSGNPTAVGVNLSEKATENLGHEPMMFLLKLPKQGGLTLYDHIALDWNPGGHPPMDIYTLPHFDLHFYMISPEARMAIPGMAPFGPSGIQFDTPAVPQAYVPPGYHMDPGIVPQMGVHWADENSPEFNGQTFSTTYILGSYQGNFIFHEPMFTLDFLRTKPNVTIPIPQAAAVQRSGYYPQSYSYSYSATPKEYTIALTDLVYKHH